MATINFADILGKSQAFNASADVLAFGAVDASSLTFAEAAGNVTVTNSTGVVTTLTGVTLAQFASGVVVPTSTSNVTNLTFSGSGRAIFGDDSVASTADGTANTINTTSVTGNHSVYGLGGADLITTGTDSTIVKIFGGAGVVDSTDGADTITSASATSTVYGNAGNDSITVNPSTASSVFGGLGNDTIVNSTTAAGTIVAYGNAGNDSVSLTTVHTGNFTIYGGNGAVDSTDGNDTIATGVGGGLVYGNAGNDAITLNADKSASVYGGLGNDTVTGVTLGDLGTSFDIRGGAGQDTFTLALTDGSTTSKNALTVYGGDSAVDTTDGADSITINSGGNVSGATAVVYANAGNDTVSITQNIASTVFGGLGDDGVTTSGGVDSILGGAGNDTLNSGTGNDTVDGEAGNDSITVGAGTVSILGGAGLDTITSAGAILAASYVDAGADNDSVTLAGNNTGANTIIGGLGNDTIAYTLAASATSTVWGGSAASDASDGADSITVTGVNATSTADVFLGAGNDTFLVVTDAKVTVSGAEGNDTITSLASADSIDGGVGNDVINAGAGNNTVLGGDGNDGITVAGGTDSIDAGAGNDTIDGGAANDTILGGADNDSITGGAGNDSLTGGSGADIFVKDAVAFSGGVGAGVSDTITDFTIGSDQFDFAGTTGLQNGAAATSTLTSANTLIVTSATANAAANLVTTDLVYLIGASNDQLAAGTTAATAVANAVTALTSIADFAAANVATGDSFLLVLDDGTNSFLFQYVADGTAATTAAADLELLAVINGVADAGTFTATTFI
jgi:Ca2+-binding RTX toxin-like protein